MNLLGLTPPLQQENPIFVFASGHRTGSTLLQRLLNSSANILIWGEQKGYLNQLLPIFRGLQQWGRTNAHYRQVFLNEGYDNFTANMLPEKFELKEAMILHLYGLFGVSATRLGRANWGFKEVRYGVNMALFLQDCFPRARFIHLTRDISACYLSMKRWEESSVEEWRHEWTLDSLNNWERINSGFLEQGSQLRNLMTVRFEDMTARQDDFVKKLADFLQEPISHFDKDVFKKKISTASKGQNQPEKAAAVQLSEEERALLFSPERMRLMSAYGYPI